jgi:hypothetical protein
MGSGKKKACFNCGNEANIYYIIDKKLYCKKCYQEIQVGEKNGK